MLLKLSYLVLWFLQRKFYYINNWSRLIQTCIICCIQHSRVGRDWTHTKNAASQRTLYLTAFYAVRLNEPWIIIPGLTVECSAPLWRRSGRRWGPLRNTVLTRSCSAWSTPPARGTRRGPRACRRRFSSGTFWRLCRTLKIVKWN